MMMVAIPKRNDSFAYARGLQDCISLILLPSVLGAGQTVWLR